MASIVETPQASFQQFGAVPVPAAQNPLVAGLSSVGLIAPTPSNYLFPSSSSSTIMAPFSSPSAFEVLVDVAATTLASRVTPLLDTPNLTFPMSSLPPVSMPMPLSFPAFGNPNFPMVSQPFAPTATLGFMPSGVPYYFDNHQAMLFPTMTQQQYPWMGFPTPELTFGMPSLLDPLAQQHQRQQHQRQQPQLSRVSSSTSTPPNEVYEMPSTPSSGEVPLRPFGNTEEMLLNRHRKRTHSLGGRAPHKALTYASLIIMAILKSPGRHAKIQDIYRFIENLFETRMPGESLPQNFKFSVRHNLSTREFFVRESTCRNSHWAVKEEMLAEANRMAARAAKAMINPAFE